LVSGIDSHIGIPCNQKNLQSLTSLLLLAGYDKTHIPPEWKDSGLQWFRNGQFQVQLIPKSFNRTDADPAIMKAMVTIPHLALRVDQLPGKRKLQEIGLNPLGEVARRPDGLYQLYAMPEGNPSYFLELNARKDSSHQRKRVGEYLGKKNINLKRNQKKKKI